MKSVYLSAIVCICACGPSPGYQPHGSVMSVPYEPEEPQEPLPSDRQHAPPVQGWKVTPPPPPKPYRPASSTMGSYNPISQRSKVGKAAFYCIDGSCSRTAQACAQFRDDMLREGVEFDDPVCSPQSTAYCFASGELHICSSSMSECNSTRDHHIKNGRSPSSCMASDGKGFFCLSRTWVDCTDGESCTSRHCYRARVTCEAIRNSIVKSDLSGDLVVGYCQLADNAYCYDTSHGTSDPWHESCHGSSQECDVYRAQSREPNVSPCEQR